jgi:1,4-dihydroxy-2-naphthoate octaprenyltransferase
MPTLVSWIKAARLRTLPLAFSSVLMGGGIAFSDESFNHLAFVFAALTAFLLQILSNFANDYGDFASGVDNSKRVGPTRTVQSGAITSQQMKAAIFLFSVLSLATGLVLLFVVSEVSLMARMVFVGLGFMAILAAILYTVGSNPYGYKGFGEVFVFLFFGVLGVGGTFFLSAGYWKWSVLLPAFAMGLLSAGVLNINNMRDIENDIVNSKRTIATRIGLEKAKVFQAALVLLPFFLLFLFLHIEGLELISYGFLIVLPLFVGDLIAIQKSEGGKLLDPFLRKLAIKTLLLALVYIVLINV